MSKIKPLARKNDIVIQEFGNEILIYDLKSNKAYNLNETSTLIWQLSNGERTISEIAENLSQIFNSQLSEEFVWLALEQMRREKLVENENEISNLFENVSRRDLIRRVGLASIIALPIVSSLVAPNAVFAGSCNAPALGPGGTPNSSCTKSCQCQTGCCRAPAPNPGNPTICGAPNINPCIF